MICERALLVPLGPTLIPDRINFSSSGKVSIIDYKTGRPKKEDKEQILSYSKVLNEMGYEHSENILVYFNDKVDVLKI